LVDEDFAGLFACDRNPSIGLLVGAARSVVHQPVADEHAPHGGHEPAAPSVPFVSWLDSYATWHNARTADVYLVSSLFRSLPGFVVVRPRRQFWIVHPKTATESAVSGGLLIELAGGHESSTYQVVR
jgi:hypothetical protein